MAAGGLPVRRIDQRLAAQSHAGVGPAPSNVFVGRIVIVSGAGGGVFVYDPVPGPGNLIASMTDATHDPFGNATIVGFTSYNKVTHLAVSLNANLSTSLTFFSAASEAGPYTPFAGLEATSNGGTNSIALSGGLGLGSATFPTEVWLMPSGDTTGATDPVLVANAYAAGALEVICLPGNFWGTPVVPANCSLRGCGSGTVWNLPASSPTLANMITNATNAQYCRISDMTLDGNNGAQGAGAWQSGIVLNNGPADGRHMVTRVRVQNFTGDGVVQVGRGSSQFSDISVFNCLGFGFNVHEDCYFVNCDIGASGIDGFIIQGGSNRIVGCKSWFSGAALVSGRGVGATLLSVTAPANSWDGGGIAGLTFSLANGYGSGFHWSNISGASEAINASGGSYAGLGAQDNARNGFLIHGRRQTMTAIEADSNNNNGTSSGIIPNASYAGVEMNGTRNNVQGYSWNRAANVNSQAAALQIISSAGSNTGNKIDLGFEGSLNDASNMPPLTASSTVYDNSLTFRTNAGWAIEFPAFAASFTPDPFMCETTEMTLTGNITVNNPALAGTNTTGIFLVPGMKLTIILIEDGAGLHTVTFGGAFRGMSAANTASNITNIWTTVYDGTHWLETSFVNY